MCGAEAAGRTTTVKIATTLYYNRLYVVSIVILLQETPQKMKTSAFTYNIFYRNDICTNQINHTEAKSNVF